MNESTHADAAEKSLLYALKEGDGGAFEKLYDRYSERILYNLLRIVRSSAIAEELLQDVFLKVWEMRATIDPKRSFQAFLFQLSSNLAIDFYRKAARKRIMEAAVALSTEATYEHVEKYVDYKEAEVLLDRTISRLPPQRQRVFRLCRIEGKTYEEVAEMLSISRSTVREHMVKANAFLREQFTREYGIYLLLLAVAFHIGQ